jgi:MFS family permease
MTLPHEDNNMPGDKSPPSSSKHITFPPPSTNKIPNEAWKVLAILSSIATMVMYAETMLTPAIPTLIKEFNITYSTSSWILTIYLLTGAVTTPIAGKLSDIYGKKKVLLIILIIYIIGVSIAGFSTNISILLIARVLQGVGISMFPIAFSIVRDQFPREKMAIGQGIITSMFAAGAVIGLSIGGFIIQHYGWQTTFFTIIPIAIALLFINWRFLNIHQLKTEQQQSKLEKSGESEKISNGLDKSAVFKRTKSAKSRKKITATIDIKGAITLAIAVTSFLLVLTYLQTGGNNSSNSHQTIYSSLWIPIFLAGGVISLTLFVIVEKRATSPLVDFKLLLSRGILPADIMIMIVGFSMFLVFQTIPILIRNPPPFGFGGDPISATRVQLPFALILLVFGPTSGFIISRLRTSKSLIIGTIISAIGFLGLFLFHSTEFLISTSLGIVAIGLSLTAIGAQNTIVLNTPRQNSGISLGIASLMRIIGSSIGPALAAMYLQSNQYMVNIGTRQQSFPTAEAYDLIFLTAAILSIVSIVLAIFLKFSAPPKCQKQLPEERGEMGTTITQAIKEKIQEWPGVTTEPNRFGGVEILVDKKEMGHLHGERLADLPFPVKIKESLIRSGQALPHHIYPESGWVSYWIRNSKDIPAVIDLFRLQYERLKPKSPVHPTS